MFPPDCGSRRAIISRVSDTSRLISRALLLLVALCVSQDRTAGAQTAPGPETVVRAVTMEPFQPDRTVEFYPYLAPNHERITLDSIARDGFAFFVGSGTTTFGGRTFVPVTIRISELGFRRGYMETRFVPEAALRAAGRPVDVNVPSALLSILEAPPPPPTPGAPRGRDGTTITPPVRVKNVPPVYPAIAQSARVQGVVIVEAVIGADGKVTDARILRSIPLLDQAALDAVRQWEYTPTLADGVAVPAIMSVTVSFALVADSPAAPQDGTAR